METSIYDVIIIGAGASGVVSAISLARRAKKVLLIEHKDRILKKVLVTGNGRCNFTNKYANIDNYYANNKDLIVNLFNYVKPIDVIIFFEEIGILSKELEKGKMYPNSLQASSIVDALRYQLELLGVEILYERKVTNISKKEDYIKVDELKTKKLIIATGGFSYKELGSDGSGYELAKKLGHTITELKPVLVQLETEKEYNKGLEGIRQDVRLYVKNKEELLRIEEGELLFTPYGISGPVIFNSSYLTALYGFDISFVVDFFPEYSLEYLYNYLLNRRNNLYYLDAQDFLNGFIHKKLGMFLLKKIGIEKLNIKTYNITDDQILNLTKVLKEYNIKAISTTGFKQAQVTAGGVDSLELDNNFMSKIHKDIFFIGEIVDIFGDCGGYNLQYAFASAIYVGSNI